LQLTTDEHLKAEIRRPAEQRKRTLPWIMRETTVRHAEREQAG
jgi:hypothetical protein